MASAERAPDLIARIEALRNDNARLLAAKKAADRAAHQAKDLELRLADADAVIAGLKTENKTCADVLIAAERAAKVAKKTIAERERQLAELVQSHQDDITASRALKSTNESLLQKLKGKNALLAELQEGARRSEAVVLGLGEEMDTLQLRLAGVNAAAERREGETAQLLAAKDVLQEDLQESIYEAGALQSECMKLEREVSFCRKEIHMLKSRHESHLAVLAASHADLLEAHGKIAALHALNEQWRDRHTSATAQTKALEMKQRAMLRDAHKARPEEKALRSRADALNADRAALRASNDELINRLRDARKALEDCRERAAEEVQRERAKCESLLRKVASLERERERDAGVSAEQLKELQEQMRCDQKGQRDHKSALKKLIAQLREECDSLQMGLEEGARRLLLEQAKTSAMRAKHYRLLMQQSSNSISPTAAALDSSLLEETEEEINPCCIVNPSASMAAGTPTSRLSRPFAVRHISKWVGETEISFSHTLPVEGQEHEQARARGRGSRRERREAESSCEQEEVAAIPCIVSVAEIDPWCDDIQE